MVEGKGCSSSRSERLRRRREFLNVYAQGTKIPGALFFFFILENDLGYNRLGLTVSRKIGNPVVRNKIRRRLREIFRSHKEDIKPSGDIVLNVRRAAGWAPFRELSAEFDRAVEVWRKQESK